MENLIIRINCEVEEVSTLYCVKNATLEEVERCISAFNKEWAEETYDDSCYAYLYGNGIFLEEIVPVATFEL